MVLLYLMAYNAPFPDENFKAGPRVFPTLVPITDQQVKENKEWKELQRFEKPTKEILIKFLIVEKFIIENLWSKWLKHKKIRAGHFSQEET